MNGNRRGELTRPWVVLALAVAFACGAAGLARSQEEPPEGVVVDSSGLWWSEPMGDPYTETLTWAEAGLAAESFALGGYDDWRLPTVSELLDACEDDTLPAWLEASGDSWFWGYWEVKFDELFPQVWWTQLGGGDFWSSDRQNKRSVWMLSVRVVNDWQYLGQWWWEWAAEPVSQTSLRSAIFVRGRPANDGEKPNKK